MASNDVSLDKDRHLVEGRFWTRNIAAQRIVGRSIAPEPTGLSFTNIYNTVPFDKHIPVTLLPEFSGFKIFNYFRLGRIII